MTKLKRADGVAAYRYTFYRPGSMEDVAATIEVDEPLPQVEVGNSGSLSIGRVIAAVPASKPER
jgi:hypothetical protein